MFCWHHGIEKELSITVPAGVRDARAKSSLLVWGLGFLGFIGFRVIGYPKPRTPKAPTLKARTNPHARHCDRICVHSLPGFLWAQDRKTNLKNVAQHHFLERKQCSLRCLLENRSPSGTETLSALEPSQNFF